VQSGKRLVEIILLTKKSAARVKRRVEIICRNFCTYRTAGTARKKECRNYFTDKKTSCTGKTECRKYFADKKAGMPRKKEWRNMFYLQKSCLGQ